MLRRRLTPGLSVAALVFVAIWASQRWASASANALSIYGIAPDVYTFESWETNGDPIVTFQKLIPAAVHTRSWVPLGWSGKMVSFHAEDEQVSSPTISR